MLSASAVFAQQNGDVTKAYYAEMNAKGKLGELAVALFRAQKRSTAAKKYGRSRYRHDAYDVKNWSLSEICRILQSFDHLINWGWQRDPTTPGFEWVLYVELPTGQCSFHSASRLGGPDFSGKWDGQHLSAEHILAFCDLIAQGKELDGNQEKRPEEEESLHAAASQEGAAPADPGRDGGQPHLCLGREGA